MFFGPWGVWCGWPDRKTIAVADASIVVTELERFWVAGRGWVMVLDLKAGDVLRALGGMVRVARSENDRGRRRFDRRHGARAVLGRRKGLGDGPRPQGRRCSSGPGGYGAGGQIGKRSRSPTLRSSSRSSSGSGSPEGAG